MKRVAEEYLGEPVQEAVITVPAYFNDAQRQCTKDAGKHRRASTCSASSTSRPRRRSPTASASKTDEKIAVYDLGGGTFDISILEMGDGVFEVLATAGDTFLGGEDFDRRIVDWLLERFQQSEGIDLRGDPMALQRLKDAAEKAKCDLSQREAAEINLPFIASDAQRAAPPLDRADARDAREPRRTTSSSAR